MKSIYSTGQQCGYPPALLYEAIQDESTELCSVVHTVCYFFPIVPEILLCIQYNKLVKILFMSVHWGKILQKLCG